MLKLKIRLQGEAELIMHNGRLADPTYSWTAQSAPLRSKRKKTESDLEELARLEWNGSLYFDDSVGPYLPDTMLNSCIVNGAKAARLGLKFKAAVFVADPVSPLLYDGPRDREGLWSDGRFIRRDVAGIQKVKVVRCRPRFQEWATETTVIVDDTAINLEDFKEALRVAGAMQGLGDWRPQHGRFNGEILEVE